MNTKVRSTRISLAYRIIIIVILVIVLFAANVIAFGYSNFSEVVIGQYEDSAFRLANASANFIDGDRLDAYLAEGGTSEEYRAIWERLDKLCNGADVTFVYVIQPDLTDYDHITFVFSTVNHKSEYTPYEVGYVRETTNDEYKRKYRALYEGESEEESLLLESRKFSRAEYHLTAMVPIKSADGETNGILCVQRQTDTVYTAKQAYTKRILLVMLMLSVSTIIGLGMYLVKVVLNPIKAITREASRFASENTPAEKKLTETIQKQDEIGVLAGSIDTMEEQIQSYVEDITKITAEKEKMETELNTAARIQISMMPNDFPAFPDRSEFDVYACMDPARDVGGDFYDFFLIDEDHLCLVIADVSGKGIPGALFMMVSKIILQSCAMLGRSAAEILEKTNEAICSNNKNEMFVTVWLGILEISTGRLTAANAGHEYPAIKQPNELFELYRDKHGFVIGGLEGMKYREYELQMERGSKLFLYTDGVPEATNADGKMFGTDRMLSALNEAPEAAPKEILNNVTRAVDDFVKDAEQFDDLTMLCIEYKGPQKAGEQRG